MVTKPTNAGPTPSRADRTGPASPRAPQAVRPAPQTGARAAYVAPRLERLGAWKALTLQQSVPIGPGSY